MLREQPRAAQRSQGVQAPPCLDAASFTPLSRFPAASFEHRPQARWMVVASCRCSEYSRTTASSGTPSMNELVRPAGPREVAPADVPPCAGALDPASCTLACCPLDVLDSCLNRTLGGAPRITAPSPVDRADARPHRRRQKQAWARRRGATSAATISCDHSPVSRECFLAPTARRASATTKPRCLSPSTPQQR